MEQVIAERETSGEDMFSCFEEDSSDEEENTAADAEEVAKSLSKRDDTCGILAFHANTETSLLLHVKNTLSSSSSRSSSTHVVSEADKVLTAIDEFCHTRHWMMHVGPEKGNDILIKNGLEKSLETFLADSGRVEGGFVAVEVGTYCGYSSILLGKRLQRAIKDFGIEAHLYTVEVNPAHFKIATEMLRIAALQDIVTLVLLNEDGALHEQNAKNIVGHGEDNFPVHILKEDVLPKHCNTVHFLFLDHDKSMYLPTFISFQQSHLLQKGSVVVADNVVFADIADYVMHMKELEKKGLVYTKTIESRVEYWTQQELVEIGQDKLLDGVEITTIL